jgi:hypothetical protein
LLNHFAPINRDDYIISADVNDVNQDMITNAIIKFILNHQLPFRISDSPSLQNLMYLCQRSNSRSIVKAQSSRTVTRKMNEMFLEYKAEVKKHLQSQEFISFTLDMWSSSLHSDHFGVVAHYIDENWELQQLVIGFSRPSTSHTGEHMADLFMEINKDFGLTNKVSTITCDNASNNMKMGRILESYANNNQLGSPLNRFRKDEQIIPCLNHIMHLSVMELLRNGFKSEAADYGNVHDILEHRNDDKNDVIDNPINKVRQGILKIRASHNFKRTYLSLCQERHGLELQLIYDVKTRWSSSFDMLDRVLSVVGAYNDTCQTHPRDLLRYKLSKDEVNYLSYVASFLSYFRDVTTWLSNERCIYYYYF